MAWVILFVLWPLVVFLALAVAAAWPSRTES